MRFLRWGARSDNALPGRDMIRDVVSTDWHVPVEGLSPFDSVVVRSLGRTMDVSAERFDDPGFTGSAS